MDFSVPTNHRVKIKESQNIDKYLDLAMQGEDNCWSPWNSTQRFGKDTGGTGDQRKNQDYPDHRSVKIKRICRRVLKI